MRKKITYLIILFFSFQITGFAESENNLTPIGENSGFFTDGTNVYFYDNLIENSDAQSFETIKYDENSPLYAKDKNQVYRLNSDFDDQVKIIENADPKTFQPINYIYSKDKNHVFAFEKTIATADLETFEILEKSAYAKDKNQIYYYNDAFCFECDQNTLDKEKGLRTVTDGDPSSLIKLNNNYAEDGKHAYYNGKIIEEAEQNSFETMPNSYGYADDAKYVYFLGKIIQDADPKTFTAISYGCIYKDAKNLFLYDKKFEADTESFAYLGGLYFKDKNNIYVQYKIFSCETKKLEQADPSSFETKSLKIYRYTKDADHYFENDKIIGEVKNFNDIKDHKYAKSIQELQDFQIVKGYSDGSFKPDKEINRAEALALLMNSEKFTDKKNCFEDISNQWYAKYVCYQKEMNNLKGYCDDTFKAENAITYAEYMKLLYKIWNPKDSFSSIKDSCEEWHLWYLPYLEKAEKQNIAFEKMLPSHILTRGEAAELFDRYLNAK